MLHHLLDLTRQERREAQQEREQHDADEPDRLLRHDRPSRRRHKVIADAYAVGTVYQGMVAGALMIGFIGTLLATTQTFGSDLSGQEATHAENQSDSLLGVVLSSSWEWNEGANATTAGFAAPKGAFALDKMVYFKGATWSTANNLAIDYPEAKSQWGTDDGFHLRIRPLTATGTYDLSSLTAAYVADWTEVGTIYVPLGTDASMLANARSQISTNLDADSIAERAALAATGVGFEDKIHLAASFPTVLVNITVLGEPVSVPLVSQLSDLTLMDGDVFLDGNANLGSTMASHWNDFDVVVIGSGASPTALQQGSWDQHLANHVNAGGLAIALGGTSNDAWLDKITLTETANSGVRTPDLNHPLLQWPYTVPWYSFDAGSAWASDAAPSLGYQHVLGAVDAPTLAVTKAGAAGDGMMILASQSPSGDDGMAFLTNMMAYYQRSDLFLDFGETIPDDRAVAAAVRTVWANDSGGAHIALRAELHFWDA